MITIELEGLVNVKELKHEIRKNDDFDVIIKGNTCSSSLRVHLSRTDMGCDPKITVDKAIRRWDLDEFVPKYGVSIADHVHHSGKLTRSKWRTNYDIRCKTINEKIILDDIIKKRLHMQAHYFTGINLYTLRAIGQSEPAAKVDAEGFIRVHGTSEQIAALSSTTCDDANVAMIKRDGDETRHVPDGVIAEPSVSTGLRMIVNSDLVGNH